MPPPDPLKATLRPLLWIDAAVQDLVERCYLAMLDRWGILVGSFRASFGYLLVLSALVEFAVNFADVPPGPRIVGLAITGALMGSAFYALWMREHLVEENALQRAGAYAALNARAEPYRGWTGLAIRALVFLVVGPPGCWLVGTSAWGMLPTLVLFTASCFARGVRVRDRERKTVPELALEPGGA